MNINDSVRRRNRTAAGGAILAAIGVLLCMTLSRAATSGQERLSLNPDWRFIKGDPSPNVTNELVYANIKPWMMATGDEFVKDPSAAKHPRPEGNPGGGVSYVQNGFDDSGWRKLNLPHDWGIEGPFEQGLPGETGKLPWAGIAWYRKHLTIPASDQGKQIYLDIDGAMAYANVWLNGQYVGGWPYGYASWRLDLTPYVKVGADNVLAIRLENPPESSRWYPGGGIYRNVWLVKTAPIHVGHWGTYITTPKVHYDAATVTVRTTVANDSKSDASVIVRTQIHGLNAAGEPIARVAAATEPVTLQIAAGKSEVAESEATVANPALWSIASPHRYVAVTTVEQNGKVIDTCETPFGIRSLKFDPDNGFLLNGQQVRFNGVCDHHDLGALGPAINVRALERQLQLLREMGCNAIRTSHNPPAPELLDLCDRMGFVVMDEAFDCWVRGKKRNDYHLLFPDWHEKDMRAQVDRDRNHPCVVLWSIGNEIGEQANAAGHQVGAELARFVHEEDPTRPVTAGCNNLQAGYNGFQKVVDVFGYNYKPGEYAKFHRTNPGLMLFGSETASTISSRGEYFFPVSTNKAEGKADFQMSSYDLYAPRWATTPDTEFKGQDQYPFVAGEFVWTGWDYLGEPTPYNADTTNLLNFTDPAEQERMEKELAATRQDQGAVAQFLLRHHRSGRIQERPVLPLSGAVASRPADGAHSAALELAGPGRPGHACVRVHIGRRGGTVPERPIARTQEEGPIRIPALLERREISARHAEGRRLQEWPEMGDRRGQDHRRGGQTDPATRPRPNPRGWPGPVVCHRNGCGQERMDGPAFQEQDPVYSRRTGRNRGDRQRRRDRSRLVPVQRARRVQRTLSGHRPREGGPVGTHHAPSACRRLEGRNGPDRERREIGVMGKWKMEDEGE